jgi:hypothetical protein
VSPILIVFIPPILFGENLLKVNFLIIPNQRKVWSHLLGKFERGEVDK